MIIFVTLLLKIKQEYYNMLFCNVINTIAYLETINKYVDNLTGQAMVYPISSR